ncbi:MAG: hypothetical protein WAV40_02740 [Microgenomates group bacterium]
MAKSLDIRISESDGGEAERALKHTALNLKILGYLDQAIEDRSLCGQALNQSVIYLEIAMGYREKFKDKDYKIVVQRTRDRNIITREMFENILTLLEIENAKREKLLKFWD